MANNNYSAADQFYKVSFITTHSDSIPKILKQTGALTILYNPDTGRRSLWFRGDLVASGYGVADMEEMSLSTYFIENMNAIFGGPNGVYDFIPSYTSPNGEVGISIYDRLSYTDDTLVQAYTNSYLLHSYNYEWTGNLQSYVWDTYAYIGKTFNSVYKDLCGYVKSSYDTGYNTDKAIYSYLISSYAYTMNTMNSVYKDLSAYVKHSYDIGYATDVAIYSYCTDFTTHTYQMMHKYTDRVIEKLIGGAPEMMDTLGEMSYLLQKAESNGLQTVYWLNQVRNDYMSRYAATNTNPAYAYMNMYAYKLVPVANTGFAYVEDGPQSTDDPANYIQIGNTWYNTSYTYTYYTYNVSKDGFLATKSQQVSCTAPFDNRQLTDILELNLSPYPYRLPEFWLNPKGIRDIQAIEAAYGDYVNIPISIDYNPYDTTQVQFVAGGVTLWTGACGGDNVKIPADKNKTYVKYDDYVTLETSYANVLASTVPTTYFDNFITMNYGDARLRHYPTTRILSNPIYDYNGKYNAGSFKLDPRKDLWFKTYYVMHWGQVDRDLGDKAITDIESTDSLLIKNNIIKTRFINSKEATLLWVAIPKDIAGKVISIKVEDADTSITHEIFQTVYVNNAESQWEYKVAEYQYTLANNQKITYNVYKFVSLRFEMESSVRFVLEFDDLV